MLLCNQANIKEHNRTTRSIFCYQCLHYVVSEIYVLPIAKIGPSPKTKLGNLSTKGTVEQDKIVGLDTHCCLGFVPGVDFFVCLFMGEKKGWNLNLSGIFNFYKQTKQEAWKTVHK